MKTNKDDDDKKCDPMLHAIENNNLRVIKRLFHNGYKKRYINGQSLFYYAIKADQPEVLLYLIQYFQGNYNLENLLFDALNLNQLPIASLIIHLGYDVNSFIGVDHTILSFMCRSEVNTNFLISKGANPLLTKVYMDILFQKGSLSLIQSMTSRFPTLLTSKFSHLQFAFKQQQESKLQFLIEHPTYLQGTLNHQSILMQCILAYSK